MNSLNFSTNSRECNGITEIPSDASDNGLLHFDCIVIKDFDYNELTRFENRYSMSIGSVMRAVNEMLMHHASIRFLMYDRQGLIDNNQLQEELVYLQQFSSKYKLNFQISAPLKMHVSMWVQSAVVARYLDSQDGSTRVQYANGLQEIIYEHIDEESYRARRTLSDGTIEEGEIHAASLCLLEGTHITLNDRIQTTYATYHNLGSVVRKNCTNQICLATVHNQLLCLEKKNRNDPFFIISPLSIEDAAFSLKGYDAAIRILLNHPDFAQYKSNFFKFVFTNHASGLLNVWSFQCVEDILKEGSCEGLIDPCKIVDSMGRNLFVQAVVYNDLNALQSLIRLYPIDFQKTLKDVLRESTLRGYSSDRLQKALGELVEKGQLQRAVYDEACQFYNPFFQERECTIAPTQYAVHMLWINRLPMDPQNEPTFLFGKGNSPEERQAHFQHHFVQPIVTWATKNLGSTICIWVDRLFALDTVVMRSEQAVSEALNNQEAAFWSFRNIRDLAIVQQHPNAFAEDIPLYYRVDLLKACIADHALRENGEQFVVVTDLDVAPMSKTELFDSTTVQLLTQCGVVMAKFENNYFENSFQMFNKYTQQTVDLHSALIINKSIKNATKKVDEQAIYRSYHAFFHKVCEANERELEPTLWRGSPTNTLVKPVSVPASHFCAKKPVQDPFS